MGKTENEYCKLSKVLRCRVGSPIMILAKQRSFLTKSKQAIRSHLIESGLSKSTILS